MFDVITQFADGIEPRRDAWQAPRTLPTSLRSANPLSGCSLCFFIIRFSRITKLVTHRLPVDNHVDHIDISDNRFMMMRVVALVVIPRGSKFFDVDSSLSIG